MKPFIAHFELRGQVNRLCWYVNNVRVYYGVVNRWILSSIGIHLSRAKIYTGPDDYQLALL